MPTAKFDYLVNQLSHSLPTIRFNAVRALGEYNSPEIITVLQKVMENDRSSGVREAAQTVLNDLGYLAQQ